MSPRERSTNTRQDLVGDLLPPTSPDEWEAGILRAQSLYHELGITAWQDASVDDEAMLAAYRAVAERGELTMRVEGNLLWDRTRGSEQIDALLAQRAEGSVGRLRLRGAKIFADGVLENFTGALLEPYVGTDNYGISMLTPEELQRAVVLLDAHGFQVHVHTIGDRAVRDALDAIEAAALANGARDARHHFAHLQLVHPDDLPRFAQLGVAANVSPLWACSSGYVDELTVPFIGPERSARMYPFGSLLQAGARLAFGSDWSVSTPDPLPQLEVAVTRIYPETRDWAPLLPDEAIDLPTALRTFTAGSAYVNFLDGETGTIEPGSSPTWSCSTGTSWIQARARSATPASSSPWSRASRSTPIRRSAGSAQRPRSSSFRPSASCSLRSQSAKNGSTIRYTRSSPRATSSFPTRAPIARWRAGFAGRSCLSS